MLLSLDTVDLMKGLWLAVDKVIHHDDVVLPIIIRSRGNVTGCDPHARDARVIEHDTEKGKTPIARRGRNETTEQKLAVGVEVLHQRARPTVSLFLPRPAPIWLVNVCEDRAEATDRCWVTPFGAGHEEQSFGDIAPYRSERARRAEGAKDVVVGRIVEEYCKARGGQPAKDLSPV